MGNHISNDEAIQIATMWLNDNKLAARLSVQKTALDQSSGCWQMSVHANYSEESNRAYDEIIGLLESGQFSFSNLEPRIRESVKSKENASA